MAVTTFELQTHDGVPVVVHRWEPQGSVRAVVNLVHGMAEHAARYDHVAEALNAAGIAVYAEDHRGHGRTARSDEELGHFADERGWVKVLDDLHRVTLRAREDHPDVPVLLLGHSLGAVLIRQYLFTFPEPIAGVALSGTALPSPVLAEGGALVSRVERRRLGGRGHSKLLHTLLFGAYNKPFEPARTEFDWLSRDPAAVDRYLADPRCGFACTTQFYVDIAAGSRVVAQVERVRAGVRPDLPVYIFSGGDDPSAGSDGAAKLAGHYAAAGLTAVEYRRYEGGRHEMLNESNRDEVLADLLGWFERQLEHAATA
jgi:alpha-beta hydrolase superfamily lysophospholipase